LSADEGEPRRLLDVEINAPLAADPFDPRCEFGVQEEVASGDHHCLASLARGHDKAKQPVRTASVAHLPRNVASDRAVCHSHSHLQSGSLCQLAERLKSLNRDAGSLVAGTAVKFD